MKQIKAEEVKTQHNDSIRSMIVHSEDEEEFEERKFVKLDITPGNLEILDANVNGVCMCVCVFLSQNLKFCWNSSKHSF